MKRFPFVFFTFFILIYTFGQEEEKIRVPDGELALKGVVKSTEKLENLTKINPKVPSKARFYSTVFPGLGQIYNESYWKAPIVCLSLATSYYFYNLNHIDYQKYRRAFKERLSGKQDKFYHVFSLESLESLQKSLLNNRNISLLFLIGFYIFQIMDASVDAHLNFFNLSNDLSLIPVYNFSKINYVGMALNLKF